MTIGKEAGKVGLFGVVVWGMYKIAKKLEGTWAGILLLRGESKCPKKK